jgi:bla regulator protein blaR1
MGLMRVGHILAKVFLHLRDAEWAGGLRLDMTPRDWSSTGSVWGHHLWQSAALAAIICLTALLLRRNPGIGRKMILAACGFLALVAPLAFGNVRMIPIHGQILHASGPLPSFEVVTIRPWRRPLDPPPPPPPPAGITAPNPALPDKIAPINVRGQTTDRVHSILSARLLIAFAYNVPFGFEKIRVLGGPDWLGSDDYEIQAKIEDSLYAAMQKMSPAQQREQVDLMEQSLLADRFKLKVHFETREMPVYALTIAKGGPKLIPAKDGESSRLSVRQNEMTARAVTLDQWIHSPFLGGRMVVDQTGLTGTYDFTLTWSEQSISSGIGEGSGTDAPSLFTAVQEQLGLKLIPAKAPVEVIVIDHIDRPSEN